MAGSAIHVEMKLTIQPDGTVSELVHLAGDLPKGSQEQVESAVRRWTFEPGRIQGQPVVAVTFLGLTLEVGKSDAGKKHLVIQDAVLGPRRDVLALPKYPRELRRKRVDAIVYLAVQTDVDGMPDRIDVRFAMADQTQYSHTFAKLAADAAESFRFQPEQLNGTPVSSRQMLQVTFCTEEAGCEALKKAAREMTRHRKEFNVSAWDDRGGGLPRLMTEVLEAPIAADR